MKTTVTKQEMIENLFDMVKEGVKRDSYTLIRKAFRECLEWNDKHPDNEIFMEEDPDYITIEDDVIYLDPRDEFDELANLPDTYAEIEYEDMESPEAILGSRFDDMNFTRYMER